MKEREREIPKTLWFHSIFNQIQQAFIIYDVLDSALGMSQFIPHWFMYVFEQLQWSAHSIGN